MGLIKVVSEDEQLYELPSTDNIYVQARNNCIRGNVLKYPFQRYDAKVDARVRDFAKSRNMNIDVVRRSVLNDPVAWAMVVHPLPEKQNYQEKALHNFLVGNNINCVNLSAGGVNAKYLNDGKIITNVSKKPKSNIKSLDLECSTASGGKVYVVAKYTQGGGGSQDNQAKDARLVIDEYSINNDFKLALVLDGTYYSTMRKKTNGTIMDDFLTLIDQKGLRSHVFVGDHQQFLVWLMNN